MKDTVYDGPGQSTLVCEDFEQAGVWQTARSFGAGTIIQAGGKEGSFGLELNAHFAGLGPTATSTLTTGALAVANPERDHGLLTVSFDLLASSTCRIRVRVESHDQNRTRTGGLAAWIYPASTTHYRRYALELAEGEPFGAGLFDSTDPYVSFGFDLLQSEGWTNSFAHRLCLDNLHYARPAYYVGTDGDDSNSGRSQHEALRTPQKAIDGALPGDIIVLTKGTYGPPVTSPPGTPTITFKRSGLPANWITIKNYPGHSPVLSAAGQCAVMVDGRVQEMAYLEVRGIGICGNGDSAASRFSSLIGTTHPDVDSRGIDIVGSADSPQASVHHVRIARCHIQNCTADGIFIDRADHMSIENNAIEDNCHTTIGFAPSGIGVMHHANFDGQADVHKFAIIGNRVIGNRVCVYNHPYGAPVKTGYYNGNGILIDANALTPPRSYWGRTLVQNNIVARNGAGGVQMWGSHHIDVVNNTILDNGQTPELKWGQMGLELCQDIRVINNVIVSQDDVPLDSWFSFRPDVGTADIRRSGNLYLGGSRAPLASEDDLVLSSGSPALADLINPDFSIPVGSPAALFGEWSALTPCSDVEGNPRPRHFAPTAGAVQ